MGLLQEKRRRPAVALVFTVQDRRNRARALLEMQQRKAALLCLDTEDVAHRLAAMRPPEELLDDRSAEQKIKSIDSVSCDGETSPRRAGMTFEQWAENGFVIDCWRPLLAEELYHPIEAEQEYFKAKYSKIRKLSVIVPADSPDSETTKS